MTTVAFASIVVLAAIVITNTLNDWPTRRPKRLGTIPPRRRF